jgi:hypothetical protein
MVERLRGEALALVDDLNHAKRVETTVFLQVPAQLAAFGVGYLAVGHSFVCRGAGLN